MKLTRKLLCTALLAALLLAVAAPALALEMPKSITFYKGGGDEDSNVGRIPLTDIDVSSPITNIKSSNKSVATYGWLNRDVRLYDEEGSSGTFGLDGGLYINLKKAGDTTISLKTEGKTYSTKVKVVKYANPVKTFIVTSLENKNLKSKFAKRNYAVYEMTAKSKAGTFKLAAASGWKIVRASWEAEDTDDRYSVACSAGVSKLDVPVPPMKLNQNYYFRAAFKNTKTKGIVYIEYYIQNRPGE